MVEEQQQKEEFHPYEGASVADLKEEARQEAQTGMMKEIFQRLDPTEVPKESKELAAFLRDYSPDLEGVEDEEIVKAWEGGKVEREGKKKEVKEAWKPEGFAFLKEDGTVLEEFPDGVREFLEKAKIQYRALGKDQQKSLAEVVRNASRGHLNSRQQEASEREIDGLLREKSALAKEVEQLQEQASTWDAILQSAAFGNTKPLEEAILGLAQAMQQPQRRQQQDYSKMDASTAGQRVFDQQLKPYIAKVAQDYGMSEQQVPQLEEYVLNRIAELDERYGGALDATRVQRFLTVDLLGELDDMDMSGGQSSAEVAELRKQNEALQAKLENLTQSIEEMRSRSGAPASGPGGGTGNESMGSELDKRLSKVKSAAEGFALLRG